MPALDRGVYVVYVVDMPLPRPLCTRLPSELEGRLEQRFFEEDWAPSEGLRTVVREWLALDCFARIEFRSTRSGRRAALRDGPEVWEVAAAAGPSRAMSAAVGQKYARVPGEALEEALAYARTNREEIDRIVAREARLSGA